MAHSIRQFDLFDGILPPDTPLGNYSCQPASPPQQTVPARAFATLERLRPRRRGLAWRQLEQSRKALAPRLETCLRDKGWPYVSVTEARKAIFGGSDIKAFDYLIYSSTGPNLLVLLVTRRPTAEQVEQMTEWEKIFGKDFQAALVFQAAGQWRLIALKDLQTQDPLAQSRLLSDCLGPN
jgi:hypothetical protein